VTEVAWYPIAAFLALGAACAAWVAATDLRHRQLNVGAVVALAASLGILYVIFPVIFPPAPPPPDADGFVLHYDIRTRTTWITPALVLLLFLALAGGAVFAAVRSYKERYWSQLAMTVPALALVFGGGWYAVPAYVGGAWELVRAAERGDYDVAEGPVTDYELTGSNSRWHESFKVGGVAFSYSSGSANLGFGQPAPRGGPIRPGLHVRIAHRDGVILRLEVRE
jgi:hypothetical protein